MIRPESFVVATDGEQGPNTVTGAVEDVTLTGGVVDIRVRLGDAETVNVRRLTTRDFRAMERGRPITLSVKSSDVMVLE
ncbi:TOBE domain-containing protein [Mesorhizobium sp. BR1-1-7]|nr:TOBE domain-containing protein [Mesorhizobium sp. BR1-1-7]